MATALIQHKHVKDDESPEEKTLFQKRLARRSLKSMHFLGITSVDGWEGAERREGRQRVVQT